MEIAGTQKAEGFMVENCELNSFVVYYGQFSHRPLQVLVTHVAEFYVEIRTDVRGRIEQLGGHE